MAQILDRELNEPENQGVVDVLDIVSEHMRAVNREREVISFELSFLGLLHVLSEKSKRSKLYKDYLDRSGHRPPDDDRSRGRKRALRDAHEVGAQVFSRISMKLFHI